MTLAIRCPGCDRTFRVPDTARGRRAKCKGCGAPIVVPTVGEAAAPEPGARADADPLGERAPRTPGPVRPLLGTIASLASALLGLVAVPMAIASELGLALFQDYALPTFGLLGIVLMAPLALLLLLAAIGLWFLRPWAWWLAMIGSAFGAAYYGKLILPVLRSLKWEHRDAASIAGSVAAFQGAPLLLFLLTIGLLLTSPVRLAYGVKSRPVRRRRRTAGTPRPRGPA